MLAIYIVIGVALFALVIFGMFYGTGFMLRRKDEADLGRYMRNEDCKWERRPDAPDETNGDTGSISYKNWEPEASGIEMRVYYLSEIPKDVEDEGVCLSIIDLNNNNGMILNGFGRAVDAMQFGDGLWNDKFLGDKGIMETMIDEKRVAWDQTQMDVIIGHYGLFM